MISKQIGKLFLIFSHSFYLINPSLAHAQGECEIDYSSIFLKTLNEYNWGWSKSINDHQIVKVCKIEHELLDDKGAHVTFQQLKSVRGSVAKKIVISSKNGKEIPFGSIYLDLTNKGEGAYLKRSSNWSIVDIISTRSISNIKINGDDVVANAKSFNVRAGDVTISVIFSSGSKCGTTTRLNKKEKFVLNCDL